MALRKLCVFLSDLCSNSSEVADFLELKFSEDLVNIFSDIFSTSLDPVKNFFSVELDLLILENLQNFNDILKKSCFYLIFEKMS